MDSSVINWVLLSVNGVLLMCVAFFISRLINGIEENSKESSRLTTVMTVLNQRLDVFEKEHLTDLKRRISNLEIDCSILAERDHELANAYAKLQVMLLDEEGQELPKIVLPKRNRKRE